MLSYRRAPEGKKEVDDLSIQVYSGASQHQSAEIALVRRHICIFLILVFFAFPISSVLTRRKPAPELSTSSWNVEETRPVVDTSTNPPLNSWNGCLGSSCPDVSCGSNKCKNGGYCEPTNTAVCLCPPAYGGDDCSSTSS